MGKLQQRSVYDYTKRAGGLDFVPFWVDDIYGLKHSDNAYTSMALSASIQFHKAVIIILKSLFNDRKGDF